MPTSLRLFLIVIVIAIVIDPVSDCDDDYDEEEEAGFADCVPDANQGGVIKELLGVPDGRWGDGAFPEKGWPEWAAASTIAGKRISWPLWVMYSSRAADFAPTPADRPKQRAQGDVPPSDTGP